MSAVYSLGAILSLPLVPWVTDHLGRRLSIVSGSVFMVIGAALQAASQDCMWSCSYEHTFGDLTERYSVAMFIVARLLLGFGIPFAIVAASSLIGGMFLFIRSAISMLTGPRIQSFRIQKKGLFLDHCLILATLSVSFT